MGKNKRVFVLGSGFSKSLISDMPLISGFFSENNRKLVNRNNDKKFEELYQFISDNNKIFGESEFSFNVERLATFLHSNSYYKNKEDKYYFNIVKDQLINYINSLIKYSSFQSNYIYNYSHENIKELYFQFKEKVKEICSFFVGCDENTTFVTYNYDLILERILLSARRNVSFNNNGINRILEENGLDKCDYFWEYKDFLKVSKDADTFQKLTGAYRQWKLSSAFNLTTGYGFRAYPFEKLHSDNGQVRFINSKIKIYKLHGSINWFKYKGYRKADFDNIAIGVPNTDTYFNIIQDHQSFLENEGSIKSMFEPIPEIIPMTYTKGLYLEKPLYEIIWSRAYKSLLDADEIYFIGYSFPDTDINNIYFYKSFDKKIAGICVKSVDENDFNRFKDRINVVFPRLREGVFSNKDACEYLSELS